MFRIFRRRKSGEHTAEAEAEAEAKPGGAPAGEGGSPDAGPTDVGLADTGPLGGSDPHGGAEAAARALSQEAAAIGASGGAADTADAVPAPVRTGLPEADRLQDATRPAPAPRPDPAPEAPPAVAHPVPAAAGSAAPEPAPEPAPELAPEPAPEDELEIDESAREAARVGLFEKLRVGLGKTRGSLAEGMGNLILGRKEITEEALEDLETALLLADVGVEATRDIVARLTESVRRRELADSDALFGALGERLRELLEGSEKTLEIDLSRAPFVIMMVGVNGAGKTTTIGKLAKHLQRQGVSVLLAAGDTFRAAAVEQLQTWGERNGVPVIAQGQGSDSASVIFDAMEAARARGIEVVLADTAGRLQNKQGLMDELSKIRRVMAKFGNEAPHETLLVLDGNTGQNGISQAKLFSEAVPVSGLVLTKLDGTAKGGVVFAVARQTGLPIYYVGVGEGIDDLRPFEAEAFVQALLERDAEDAA